jgi:hypothetical protein
LQHIVLRVLALAPLFQLARFVCQSTVHRLPADAKTVKLAPNETLRSRVLDRDA